MTVAAFMELALYDSEYGYYARAAQRSGRAGDFFTSIDIGPLFGELVEVQIAEMFRILRATAPSGSAVSSFDLVEAGAGNGRLSADILRAARHAWRPRRSAAVVDRLAPRRLRRRRGGQRAPRRDAGASGRHARGRF